MKEKNEQNDGAPQQGGANQPQAVPAPVQPAASTSPCPNVAQRPGAKLVNGQDNTGPSATPQTKGVESAVGSRPWRGRAGPHLRSASPQKRLDGVLIPQVWPRSK